MDSTKPELRKSLKAKRLSLSNPERQAKSRIIREKLVLLLKDLGVKSIHCYEPMLGLGEVDISGLSGGHDIYVSKKIDGEWKVVPPGQNGTIPEQFDAVIVPMLGFDERLHRLGYGGGYYDKFLSAQPDAKKIGVCFETGKMEEIPAEPHDVSLDCIITEQKVYLKHGESDREA